MGCGASAGRAYECAYEIRKQSSIASGDSMTKMRTESKERASKEIGFHDKNCTDLDFSLVKTIEEAYPFDKNNRKKVEKIVKRGTLKEANHGTVDVAVVIKKINCDVCQAFIVDWKGEAPFYFCKKCRKSGRKCQVCVKCLDSKAHLGSAGAEGYRSPSKSPRGSLDADWPRSPTTGSRSSARAAMHAEMSMGKTKSVEPPGSYWASEGSRAPSNSPCASEGSRAPSKSPRGSLLDMDSPKSPTRGSISNARAERRAEMSMGMTKSVPASYWGGHLQVKENERSADILMGPKHSYRDTLGAQEFIQRAAQGNLTPSASPRSGSSQKPPAWFLESGIWAGNIDEAGGKRRTQYSLNFQPDGGMSGIGPENCTITGNVSAFHVEWSEQHAWGTLQAHGTMKSGDQIVATFKASDGGGGKIELKARMVRARSQPTTEATWQFIK